MQSNNPTPQDLLAAAGLHDLVLLPDSDAYQDRQASYWAANAPMRPACIVQPCTTDEVSRIVKVLAKANYPVALRSGGHTQWAGSNDVKNGVTIDLGRMTVVTYDGNSKLASIQPGVRWIGVYEELLKHQVCVTGGREGNVGVGGFLTGGGISWYAALEGLGCDNVANFEVVLATGEVVNANASSHPDLWIALKGGSGNFCIVTRFDMFTFPAHDLLYGVRVVDRTHGDECAQFAVAFTDENYRHPHTAFLLNYGFNSAMAPEPLVTNVVVDTRGISHSSAFEGILGIEAVLVDVKKKSMADIAAANNSPHHKHQVWFTLTLKNDVRTIKHASKMHDGLVEELKSRMPHTEFSTQCIFQPWPSLYAEHSVQHVGNVLGLDQTKGNALLWLAVGSTETAEQHAIMREKLTVFSATLEDFAKSNNLNVGWRYLNYADETQNPLASYGTSKVDFMRKVAAEYDPEGVFQRKVVSGWKICNIDA
ncbi:hypothetical protein C7974DRAFT_420933 [Boeremia exigua]|uniref:uncharacterized protein n=1 Tax=Boeremia exigua TaxID=749465 RepID=UPI001E8CFEDD|nr:uncharacterized protein C7974DRAFT_420933 [Boeremia exigua]KAH6642672.1 hypothetical protein C7974DRAFT_420933 [Boeremia exigua]